MFYKLTRNEKKLPNEGVLNILEKGEYGIFSTIGTNGYPYGVPVNYVFRDNAIYFHCATGVGLKLENLKNSNKVSFCVVGESEIIPNEFTTKYKSVIAFGRAVELKNDEKRKILQSLLEKYSNEYMEKGKKYIDKDESLTSVIKIEIEHLTGKGSK